MSKILCDNLRSLTGAAAAPAIAPARRINRSYTIKTQIPALLLGAADAIAALVRDLVALAARRTSFHRTGRSAPKKNGGTNHINH